MDGHNTDITDERNALIASLQAQKIQQEKKIEQLEKSVRTKSHTIESLEERLRALLAKQYGKSSERYNPDQLSFLNEAEIIAASDTQDDSGDDNVSEVRAHKRKRHNQRKPIPDHFPRVDVHHELDESERQCDHCGNTMERIGEDVNEQLSIVPRQYFVTRHVRARYACGCKECAKNAPVPTHPLPGAQVTPVMIAHTMVSKLLDGLPLYRQAKIAARDGLDLSRTKLARWFIGGSHVFQPILNGLMDAFFSYDIAMSDDTRIKVLKTGENNPSTQSALWIRRGGPPDKPVVLVDYKASKSAKAAYSLLDEFKGTRPTRSDLQYQVRACG